MKNAEIIWKITHGMYVLTTQNGGCVVDAVSQVSGGDNPLISVAVMKKNRTNELMKQNETFALSVMGTNVNPQIIRTFGFSSSRDTDKFAQTDTTEVCGVKTINGTMGYMICEKVDSIENDTHTLFIGKVIEGNLISDEEPMSYGYYRAHKDELMKVKTQNGETAWVCSVCGYVYYGEKLPQDYKCPVCGVDRTRFNKR
ncbi:MAG: hypothetical protein HFE47_03530 [Clostridia bacterium]|nr:hypothetical protein [Clostridia bacterium]